MYNQNESYEVTYVPGTMATLLVALLVAFLLLGPALFLRFLFFLLMASCLRLT